MKKIPTLFLRDPETNFRTLTRKVHPDCAWVVNGEGEATVKLDGTCCMISNGKLYARRELKKGKKTPDNFILEAIDLNTGKSFGWVPVTDDPEFKWHNEALNLYRGLTLPHGTYELVGPKIQGNPMDLQVHQLFFHGEIEFDCPVPRSYKELRSFLLDLDSRYEGIVWHHEDGRMAKIKRRDFQ